MEADVHFDITRLLVVAEGARELSVQVSGHLLLRRGFPFGLATTHYCTQWRISKDGESVKVDEVMRNVEHGQRSVSAPRPSRRCVCDSGLTLACLRSSKSATLE